MIYFDPPYGVKFGSNFQPFIRKRDVKHGDDKHMTREPEMVQAYRDTWELGLHSYLTYLRDRFLLARELLHPSGSIFVQIGDENVHHVREVLDEVFGAENFCSIITFRKTQRALGSKLVPGITDYLIWYAKNIEQVKYRQIFVSKFESPSFGWQWVEMPDGSRRRLTSEERLSYSLLPKGARLFQDLSMLPAGVNESAMFDFEFEGKVFPPPARTGWKTNKEGMKNLELAKRLIVVGNTLRYIQYLDDFPVSPLTNLWEDTGVVPDRRYVVQTPDRAIARCLLMTTDPGDLVLDPTCGSGTTAYVAEQWGRRWITIDTSRVPLALARQRLLTATFPYYELRDPSKGPAGGFVYKRKQNKKGEEVGGIVPHITLKSIAQNEPPAEEVLVDRPEIDKSITRVSGPFVVEATIPTPIEIEEKEPGKVAEAGTEYGCLLYTSPSPRDLSTSRMPSSA